MSCIIGIDPGLSGAVVLLNDGDVVKCWDMPTTAKLSGNGSQVNAYLLADVVREALDIGKVECCYIERVSAGGGATGEGKRAMGATSAFGFGRSVGVVEGVMAALGVRVVFVSPAAWKRSYNLIGKGKDASRTLALQMFPGMSGMLKRKKDNGRSDAMIIGHYGYQFE